MNDCINALISAIARTDNYKPAPDKGIRESKATIGDIILHKSDGLVYYLGWSSAVIETSEDAVYVILFDSEEYVIDPSCDIYNPVYQIMSSQTIGIPFPLQSARKREKIWPSYPSWLSISSWIASASCASSLTEFPQRFALIRFAA